MQSGVTLSPGWHFISQEDASYWGQALAQNVNCPSGYASPLECLQNISIHEISTGAVAGTRWMPTIDPNFLPRTPFDILQSGDFNKEIEVIIGSNADDGLVKLRGAIEDTSLLDQCRENFENCGPSYLYYLQIGEISEEDILNARK